MILERFFPDIYINSIYELPLEELKKLGIRALVFDIDNTISPFDVAEPEESAVELLRFLRKNGFQICILSNNKQKRVARFNRKIRALAVHRAGKPGVRKLKEALRRMNVTPQEAAMVGDQVFTDMWCGHRAKMFCIMTKPICARDQLVTRVKRGAERWVMKRYFRLYGKK